MNKGELKSKLKFLVLDHDPELTVKDAIWDRAYHFYEGYSQCFSDTVKVVPVSDSFAQNFILEETFKYLLKIC